MRKVVTSGANPSRYNEMIASSAQFQAQNPSYNASGLQLPDYMAERQSQDAAYQKNLGRSATELERRMMFDAHMDPKEVEQNLQNVLTAQGAFAWTMGRDLTSQEQNAAVYNQPLTTRIQSQLSSALANRENLLKTNEASFGLGNQGNQIAQSGV